MDLTMLWTLYHHRAGWLSIIQSRYNITSEQARRLDDIDAEFYSMVREIKSNSTTRQDLYDVRKDNQDLARECRGRYLRDTVAMLVSDRDRIEADYAKMDPSNSTAFDRLMCLQDAAAHSKIIKKIEGELRYNPNIEKSVSPDEIARAKEYPIAKLVPAKRFPCPLHNGDNPSRDKNMGIIAGNKVKCFVCGERMDPIDWQRHTHPGMSFTEAVRSLL